MTRWGPTTAWPPPNPTVAVSPGTASALLRWTNVVEEMQTDFASQLLPYLPVFVTAPVFGFVCGFLLHAVVG